MPRDKDLKRLVRSRMQKTGEAYTTARAQITKKPARKKAPAAAPEVQPPYAELAGMSDTKMLEKTGRSWEEWVAVLDGVGAAQMPHRDIARIVNEQYGVDGWWSQSVTVGYERIRGLRERGQRRTGEYEASKSKTFNVPIEVLFDACADARRRRRWLPDVEPVVRTATKPRSIRLGWPDGTIVTLWFTRKTDEKCTLSVQHSKLPDRATAERLREYWAGRLAALANVVSKR